MKTYEETGKMMGRVMEHRRDKSKLAILYYMTNELDFCKHAKPDWGKVFKKSRQIWLENL